MRLLVAAIGLTLFAAACASSPNRHADAQWARAIVLREDDFPAYDAAAPSNGRTCLPHHLDGQTGFARSRQFSSGERSATARAWIFAREEQAKRGFRNLVAFDYGDCLQKQGVVGARIVRTAQQQFGGGNAGDRFRGIHLLVRVAQTGGEFNVYVDLVFLRAGRALADAVFTSSGQPFGDAAETTATGAMTTRMQHP